VKVAIDPHSGVIRADGRPVRERLVLADSSLTLDGDVVARDRRQGLAVYRVRGPLVSTTRVTGLYANDTWSGRRVTYRRLRCPGGRLAVLLSSDPSLFRRPQRVVARADGRVIGRARLAPTATRELVVPLRPRGGVCRVAFEVAPTAVPRVVTRGRNPDPRVLGVHFARFDFRPARGTPAHHPASP
jgi:hypothetical protein